MHVLIIFQACLLGARSVYISLYLPVSLTVLTELPLPSPLPPTFNKSLFSSPELAEEAAKLLSTQDENLLPQLIHALGQANTDCM